MERAETQMFAATPGQADMSRDDLNQGQSSFKFLQRNGA
jgi:hypothetical protein